MAVLQGVLRGLPRGSMKPPGLPGMPMGRGGPSWEAKARFMVSMGRSPEEAEMAAKAGVMLGEQQESPETGSLRAAREWDRKQKVLEDAREARAQATAKATAEAKAAEASHREKALNMLMGGGAPPPQPQGRMSGLLPELQPRPRIEQQPPGIQQQLAGIQQQGGAQPSIEEMQQLAESPPEEVQPPQGMMGLDDDLKQAIRTYVQTQGAVGLSPVSAMTEQRRRTSEEQAGVEAQVEQTIATSQDRRALEQLRATGVSEEILGMVEGGTLTPQQGLNEHQQQQATALATQEREEAKTLRRETSVERDLTDARRVRDLTALSLKRGASKEEATAYAKTGRISPLPTKPGAAPGFDPQQAVEQVSTLPNYERRDILRKLTEAQMTKTLNPSQQAVYDFLRSQGAR